ncbi:unnamed protein product [Bursaphelenchus okinawaensis]|uniref:Uncharacterized protein n=1 Tax=Bursaphelenchus okinawaensis TaxID=465554 RepID=A0A811KTA7_9BILA|nr:unnamed protein product [Bursaphelenchus okinawaensis]CAG9109741.1 unnamed protein product [Bursaphelenchus okinawaensis]
MKTFSVLLLASCLLLAVYASPIPKPDEGKQLDKDDKKIIEGDKKDADKLIDKLDDQKDNIKADEKTLIQGKNDGKLSSNQAPGYYYGFGNAAPADTSFNGAMRAMGLPPIADGAK